MQNCAGLRSSVSSVCRPGVSQRTATNLGSSQANRGASLLGGLPLRGGVSGGCRRGSPASPSSYACAALRALTAAGTPGELHSRVWWDSGLREPLGAALAVMGCSCGAAAAAGGAHHSVMRIIASTNLG
eukprot:jgi/Tetstr1/442111/TSEL_030268.t2